jgi:CheY-like chemotaxis protein/predicted regulator of Ras-like GTPase activity (Roadblock/LC7/MglB family)
MGQKATILIVDSNPGFALMLKESLEEEAGYQATVVPTGREALTTAADGSFDLAIVDLGIQPQGDLDGETVVRRLREANPDLGLIVIPLEGDELPGELSDLKVQGTLSKPFFLPDLPRLLEAALGDGSAEREAPTRRRTPPGPEVPEKPPVPKEPDVSQRPRLPERPDVAEAQKPGERPAVPERDRVPERTEVAAREEVPAKPQIPRSMDVPERRRKTKEPPQSVGAEQKLTAGGPRSDTVEAWSPAATSEIENLAREVNADAVMVSDRGKVIACVGRIREDRREALGKSIWRACQLSTMAARSLGHEPSDFEQAVEGEDYLLYTLTIDENVLLSSVLRSDTTLGFLRHKARGTARRLRAALELT